ncbi:MAG: hypothetical protein CMQ35_00005, partial [Gammaproteobacteria bacterium]|nr:hypothetical protein [Gammaproteobacteria bacterium]
PPPSPPPPVIAEKDIPSPPPPATKQPSTKLIVFDKDESVSATQYQPDDIAEYSGEDWDIRISMDHAPLEEAFYFPVKGDPDATNGSIQSVLEKYALNTDRSNELDSDKYPQLIHIQEELRDYYESGKSGRANLAIYVNKRPSGEPIQLGDTVSQHLSSCIFHDGSFDYRLLDLVFVIESKSMESSELEQYRQEYGHTFMLFLTDYMKRNSSATPGDALFSNDPFHGFLSGSNDPDQFPKVTQALKNAENAGFIQSGTPSQIFDKDLPGATTKYQPDDLAEYAGEPWDIRISMKHETLEDAFYFPVKNDPDATNESIQSVIEKYALNTDRSNELDSDEYPLMPNLQRELRGYYNSGKSGQSKLSIYVNKRPSNSPIQLGDSVAQHLSTSIFNDGSFDYRLLDLVFVIEDEISITQEGSDKLKSIKQEVDNLTHSYERYQSVLGNPPTLGVPDGDGYDARIQLMRRNSVNVVRTIFLFAFIYNEDDLFGDPNWAASYESGQSFSAIMDAFQYESKFSDKILDALVSL